MGSRFYVGQRVRITYKNLPPKFFIPQHPAEGLIGTILAPSTITRGYQRWLLDTPPPAGSGLAYLNPIEPCLEPVYDGDTPVAWSDCAWRPRALERV